MTKKKPEKKRPSSPSPCPVNCKKINLKMDCSNHPPGLPFPEREKPYGWRVNPSPRCGTASTDKMRRQFSDWFAEDKNRSIPPEIQRWAKQNYGIQAKYGKELIETMINEGLEPQMHHKLPVMLGGKDTVVNYIPIPKKDHLVAYGGVHKWWDKKLRGMRGGWKESWENAKKKATAKKKKKNGAFMIAPEQSEDI